MRKIIITGVVVVVALVLGTFLLQRFSPLTQSSGDYASHGDAESLVNRSERIVLAKYLGLVNDNYSGRFAPITLAARGLV